MKMIKVKAGGCGITHKDAKGITRHELKTPESGPFECDDAQAARLVALGVAEYVGEPAAQQPPVDPEDLDDEYVDPVDEDDDNGQQQAPEDPQDQEPEKLIAHLDAEDLATWEYNDLKKLAADMGVKPASQKKADIIAAIVAEEVEVDLDAEDLDDDDLPDMNAADPV